MYYHRAPSRLLWFFIGAGTATWWIKRKECEGRSFGPCRRLPPSSQGFPSTSNAAPAYQYPAPDPAKPSIPADSRDQAPVPTPPPQDAAPAGPRMRFPPPIWEWEKRQDREWEQDKENFIKMSSQAADVMVDLTESTLESILGTADILRAKLAEHRAAREREQKRMREQEEERRKNPPRLV
ncbi:hypothetical protein M413DRAFT_442916 [Hebeloma cylindrosporum]|uniref:Uncharacterized protein n=1 Tax=Hebeloma cylindrosporum TaxID=76867 RepID=A0A0C3CMD2_HEBCY|nr:hypothetical protein M413DRAFT_442916 [Hebeloma cylindrosporum h7]